MKKMTCRDVSGGNCDFAITANNFTEMGQKMRAHVMEMADKGDAGHIAIRERMQTATPEQRAAWLADFEKRFNALPEAQEFIT